MTYDFLLPNLASGGAERISLIIARILKKSGQEVRFINLGHEGGEISEWLMPEFDVISLNCSRSLKAIPALARFLRKHKGDTVFASRENASIAGLIACRLAGCPIILRLPNMPKNYYVELDEAVEAINNISEELEKRPISIKTLNTRVDTARDLTLKVYNTINETIKLAKMAEVAIVYGNKYRVTNKEIDMGLVRAENAFYKGNFKNSIEHAINAINIIEPGIHNKLVEDFK